jgi:16S rRNA (uracil1498-N3)-methyltransferase
MDSINYAEKWRYPRFFADKINGENAYLDQHELHHATRVIRMKQGEKAIICDGQGFDYVCEYSGGDSFRIIEQFPNKAEPNIKLTLYQCLPKSDKMDFIVQKAVELGAERIVPVISARCISRPDKNSAGNKVSRWNKIAHEAAKQCGRGKIPIVSGVMTFHNALSECNSENLCVIFYECNGKSLNEIITPKYVKSGNIDVIIGSEGGFEQSEVSNAENSGAVAATLGKRILRVDTASVTALSLIMYLTGNI